jgi:hypothetical protein
MVRGFILYVLACVAIHANNINIDAGYYLIISLICILVGESLTKKIGKDNEKNSKTRRF